MPGSFYLRAGFAIPDVSGDGVVHFRPLVVTGHQLVGGHPSGVTRRQVVVTRLQYLELLGRVVWYIQEAINVNQIVLLLTFAQGHEFVSFLAGFQSFDYFGS